MIATRLPRRSPRLVFRVAAGPRIGYGHLMRARALAQCLAGEVAISVRGGRAARDAARLVGPLVDRSALEGADLLVVDDPSREEGRAWIADASRLNIPSVAVHDDAWAHPADLVICGRLGAPLPNPSGAALNGPRFYLLDRRIAAARAHRRLHQGSGAQRRGWRAPRIIVALGGGHHVRSRAQEIADALADHCPAATVSVAAGFSRGAQPALRHARWLSARTGLVDALVDADVALVGGGVTLYETCALGVPAVGLAVVPEQRPAIRAFARAGAILDAGEPAFSAEAIARAARRVARLAGDGHLAAETSLRARRLVDGRGAERVARHILALVEKKPGFND